VLATTNSCEIGRQRTAFIAQLVSVLQGKRWVITQGDAIALVDPGIAEVSSLDADEGNVEVEAVEIGQ